MIVVIPYVIEKTTYDSSGQVVEEKGDVVVSHGENIDTGRIIIMPPDPFYPFVRQHCRNIAGFGHVLKEVDDGESFDKRTSEGTLSQFTQ